MTFRHLEAFVQVALQKSFTRAADKLCLTQPTVSGQIKELEQELGIVLFHRLPRTVQLTQVGELFLPKARDLLASRETVLEWVASYRGLVWGHLVVHASTIPGEYLLPPLLARFKQSYPEIRVSLHVQDSEKVLRAVRDGEAALGMAGKKVADDALEFEPMWSDRISLYGGQGQPVAAPVDLSELPRLPLLAREQGSGTRQAVMKALAAHGVGSGDLNVVAEFGSNSALKQAVMAGAGVGFLSDQSVHCELACERLVPIPVQGMPPIGRCFYAVRGRGRSLAPACAAFLDQLRESAAGGEPEVGSGDSLPGGARGEDAP